MQWKEERVRKVGKAKPMREAMPWVAAVVDELRKEFGAETIDAAIRGAVREGLPTFYACERGQVIGTPATMPDPARCVSVGVEQLAKGSKGS